MKKLLIFILSLLFVMPYFSIVAFAEEDTVETINGYYDIDAPEYEPEIALLVNADTDTVIYGKNADVVTAPASLTKIVTGLVVLSKCSDLQTQITCSQTAVDSLLGTGSSVIGLVESEQIIGKIFFRIWPFDSVGRIEAVENTESAEATE